MLSTSSPVPGSRVLPASCLSLFFHILLLNLRNAMVEPTLQHTGNRFRNPF
jgi:hypothetical protein